MPKYAVRLTDSALASAKAKYPAGGSSDGSPSFAQFEDGPLKAAKTAFALGFDELPDALGVSHDTAMRVVLTESTPIFPPHAFYGILGTDGTVDIVGIEDDPDYWPLVDDDPDT